MTTISGIRNLFIGAVSSFSSDNNKQLILMMNIIEAIFIVTILIGLIRFKCFRSKVRFWITLAFSLLRICIQLSLTIWN